MPQTGNQYSSSADPSATQATDFAAVHSAGSMPTTIGDWVVERKLGAGAMGEVFLARNQGSLAALKLVTKHFATDERFIQRFQREIATLSNLNHPNVAKALDGGEHDGRPWLAMEFVDGPDIDHLQKQHGRFVEADVLRLAIQVARGLEHIHAQAGLIHRDVKPANILIARVPGGDPARLMNPGDVAKLIDFGLAKPTEDEGHGLTMTGMILGTPNYISPEQIACEKSLTLHVDMYALGASMFHLLSGRVPFANQSAAAVMAAHLNESVPDPGTLVPMISSATRRIVMTTMAKKPGDRYRDWAAFILACEQSLAALEAAAPGHVQSTKFLRKPMIRPATAIVRQSSAQLPIQSGPAASALEPHDGFPPASISGADALANAVSSRITRKLQRDDTHTSNDRVRPDPTSAKQAKHSGNTSAVQRWSGRLALQGSTGGSIMPWIVLGLAAFAAIGAALWAIT